MLKNLIDPNESNARLIVEKLHVKWGHAPASQLQRIFADADGVGNTELNVLDSVADACFARKACDEAPHLPAAGTSLVSALTKRYKRGYCFWAI